MGVSRGSVQGRVLERSSFTFSRVYEQDGMWDRRGARAWIF